MAYKYYPLKHPHEKHQEKLLIMKLGLLSMIYERRQTPYVLHEEATERIQKVSLKAVLPQDRIV